MTHILSVAIAVTGWLFAGPSQAETVNTVNDLPNNKRTAAYLYSRPMLESMGRLGVEQDKRLGLQADCKSQYLVKPLRSIVLAPIDFPDDKQNPTKGSWLSRYEVQRCGEPKVYNVIFIAGSNGEPPSSRSYFPGSTYAGPILVRDAMQSATAGAFVRSGSKDCKDVDVLDMQVAEQPHEVVEEGKTFKGVWKEIWTFKVCGKTIDVPIAFIPDANGGGTTFRTDPAKLGQAKSPDSQVPLAALNMQITVETHNAPSKPETKVSPDSKETFDLTLADGYIGTRSVKETRIFESKTRRRFILDNSTKTYVEYSLYDIVGFRTREFQNREMLNGALTAAKIPGGLTTVADNEHNLSLLTRTPAKVVESVRGDELVFSAEDHQLATWSRTGVEATPAEAERFAKFLRYTQGGHPQILGKLAAARVIPAKLTLTFNEFWGTRTHTLSIQRLSQDRTIPDDLNSYSPRRGAPSSDGLDAILDQAAGLRPAALEAAKTRNRSETEKAFQDGRILEAMLGLIEWTLMAGQPMPPLSPDQSARIRSDPSVQLLTGAMRANTKEAMPDAVATLVSLRSQAPTKTYVLKIFEANDRGRMGDIAASKKLFTEVLQANLLLAGVYKDLGDVFLMQYDTPRAWRCWDAGRRLAPQFGNFSVVNQFENSLLAQHPEYF
jgi:hypothetical protein